MITILNILAIGISIYLIWALIHHKRGKSLTPLILLEYFLTAVLVFILVLGVIY